MHLQLIPWEPGLSSVIIHLFEKPAVQVQLFPFFNTLPLRSRPWGLYLPSETRYAYLLVSTT